MSKIKICGIRTLDPVLTLNRCRPDYVGFVFASSKRQVTPAMAIQIKSALHPAIQTVGVFVDHPIGEIHQLIDTGVIDLVQLHGNETETTIQLLKENHPTTPIIKAVNVQSLQDITAWNQSAVDLLLLDHGTGGTGKSFDWRILDQQDVIQKPYFIAGGLTPDNVRQVLCHHPYGVDVSGGVETDGQKDRAKIKQFIQEVTR